MTQRLLESTFFQALTVHPLLTYSVLFVVVLIEGGEAAVFGAVFLIHRGYLDPYIAFPIVFSALFSGDIGWYYVGPFIARLPLVRHIVALASIFDEFIQKHPLKAMLVSKFAYGLHRPIQMRLQKIGMTFRQYLKYELTSSLVWITVVGALAYFVMASVSAFRHVFRVAEIGLALGVILFFVASRVIATYAESLMVPKGDIENKAKTEPE